MSENPTYSLTSAPNWPFTLVISIGDEPIAQVGRWVSSTRDKDPDQAMRHTDNQAQWLALSRMVELANIGLFLFRASQEDDQAEQSAYHLARERLNRPAEGYQPKPPASLVAGSQGPDMARDYWAEQPDPDEGL